MIYMLPFDGIFFEEFLPWRSSVFSFPKTKVMMGFDQWLFASTKSCCRCWQRLLCRVVMTKEMKKRIRKLPRLPLEEEACGDGCCARKCSDLISSCVSWSQRRSWWLSSFWLFCSGFETRFLPSFAAWDRLDPHLDSHSYPWHLTDEASWLENGV